MLDRKHLFLRVSVTVAQTVFAVSIYLLFAQKFVDRL